MKQATVIYHNKDLDGFCSGAIARQGLEEQGYQVEMIGWDYGDEPEIPTSERVMMVDITYPIKDMLKMRGQKLTVIDHHKSIEPIRGDFESGEFVLDETKAACELTWEYFYSDTDTPFLVYAIAVWDIHRKEDLQWGMDFDEYAVLQNGLVLSFKDPKDKNNFIFWQDYFLYGSPIRFAETKIIGEAILESQIREGKRLGSCSFIKTINGQRFNCMNGLPNKHTEGVDGSAPLCFFYFDGRSWKYSLRQNEYNGLQDHDLLSVAKHFHGGGHANACGFKVSDLL